MAKMNLKLMNALRATLNRVASLHPDGVLMYGINHISKQTFCHLIKLERNLLKLLSCARIDIRGIGNYPKVEDEMVEWMKKHIRTPSGESFCNNLLTPGNWLKYNIAGDLHLLHLSIAEKEYWMILNFNSIKVRLELCANVFINNAYEFQFHKGAIRTR